MILLDYCLSSEIEDILKLMDFFWRMYEEGALSEINYHTNLDHLLGELSIEIGYPQEHNCVWN